MNNYGWRYIAFRLAVLIPMLIGITFISFLLIQASPGDPTSFYHNPSFGIDDLELIRSNLGLDRSTAYQYFLWLKHVMSGNLGYSYITGRPVFSMIVEKIPATLVLTLSSFFIIMVLSVPLGVLSAYHQQSIWDYGITIMSFLGMAIPIFWLAMICIMFFSLKLNIFPTSGYYDPNIYPYASFFSQMGMILYHSFLPVLSIVVGGVASMIRYNRASFIQVLGSDYITAARARGISSKRILFVHASKNAFISMVTIIGLWLPSLFGGSFVVEYIFGWPGLGKMGVEAVFTRDYPVLMGVLLFSSFLIVISNFLTDLAYCFVDPRIGTGVCS